MYKSFENIYDIDCSHTFYQENIDVVVVICEEIMKNSPPENAKLWGYSKSGIYCFDGRNLIKYNRIGEYQNQTHCGEEDLETDSYRALKNLSIRETYYVYYPQNDWASFCITIAFDKSNCPILEYSTFVVSERGREEKESLTIISSEAIENYIN